MPLQNANNSHILLVKPSDTNNDNYKNKYNNNYISIHTNSQ